MPSLSFTAPTTVEEAINALARAPGLAKPLAGGTDLLVQMRSGRMRPEVIVDLKRIPDLIGIRDAGDSFVIGAATPGVMLSEHEVFSRAWPGIVEGVDLIGSQQIQGRASLVGNLCNASPAADSVPAMICAPLDLLRADQIDPLDDPRPGAGENFMLAQHDPRSGGADHKAVAGVANADQIRNSLEVDDYLGAHPARPHLHQQVGPAGQRLCQAGGAGEGIDGLVDRRRCGETQTRHSRLLTITGPHRSTGRLSRCDPFGMTLTLTLPRHPP